MISLRPRAVDTERPQSIAVVALLIAAFAALAAVYGACVFFGILPFNSGAWVVGEEIAERGWFAYLLSSFTHFAAAIALWRQWRGARWIAVFVMGFGLLPAVPGISMAVADLRPAGIVLWGTLIVLRSASLYVLMNTDES